MAAVDWLKSPEGWGALNPQATPEEKQAEVQGLIEEFETAKLFHAVFMSGRGPELIEHLRDVLFETPIYSTNAIAFDALQIPLTPDQWCWVRVGQNSVLHHIRAMVMKAIDGPPDTEGNEHGNEKAD